MAAIVGAAGLRACLAAARAGKRLLLANKEALVVGGAAVHRRRARGRRDAAADRQRAFGDLPVPARRPARPGTRRIDHIVLTASGGPFRTPRSGDAGRRHAGPGLRASELGHGPQDLGRLGDHDEQGARGDRGALAVRPRARADRGRDPSAEHHPFDGASAATARCSRSSARPTCGCRSRTAWPGPSASTRARAARLHASWRRSPSRRPTPRSSRASHLAWDALRARAGHDRRAQRRQRDRGGGLPRRPPALRPDPPRQRRHAGARAAARPSDAALDRGPARARRRARATRRARTFAATGKARRDAMLHSLLPSSSRSAS